MGENTSRHHTGSGKGTPDAAGVADRELVAPERMVFLLSFSDEKGGVTRAPFTGEWPLEILNTVTFVEQAGRTTLTRRGVPYGATDAERKTFREGHESMQGGFGATFDQLREYLATAK